MKLSKAVVPAPKTTLLAIGGEPGKAYEPGGWEVWSQLQPLFEAGEYELRKRAG